jgi:hypothetical protein
VQAFKSYLRDEAIAVLITGAKGAEGVIFHVCELCELLASCNRDEHLFAPISDQ